MNTKLSNTILEPCEDEAEIIFVRYAIPEETQGHTLPLKHKAILWFGRVSTLAWAAAAFASNTLHIPLSARPWVFVIFIVWAFSYCVGLFDA
jgi:hypothetical protein